MWMHRRRKAAEQADALHRALQAQNVEHMFDSETRELVHLARSLRPTQSQSEASRAAILASLVGAPTLPAPRRPALPQLSGVTASTDVDERPVLMADVETITPERAAEVAANVARYLARTDGE